MLETVIEFADMIRGNQWSSIGIGMAMIAGLSIGWAAWERRLIRRDRQREARRRDDDDARSRDA